MFKGISWNKILRLKAGILYNTNNANFLVTLEFIVYMLPHFQKHLIFLEKLKFFLVKLKVIKIQVFQRGQGFNVRRVLSHTLLVTHSVIKYLWGRHVNGDMKKWPDLIRMEMNISQKNRILFLIQENSYQESSLVCNSLSLLLSQTSCLFYIIFQFCMDVRVGLWRSLSAEELMLFNCGVGEDSWESLGLQGDRTSPF